MAAVGFNLGILFMILSNSLETLLVGRAFIGLGIGIGLSIDPLFIAEITPAQHRGMLVTWSELAINVGVVFGFATSLFLSGINDDAEWRIMFLLGAILPTILIVCVFTVMPESPRWLVQRGRHEDALVILQQVYPEGFDVEPILESIKEAVQRDSATDMAVGWYFLWRPSPAVFRMLLVGVGAPLAQQAVGIDAIQYYLVDVIAASGIKSKEGQSLVLILMGLIKLGFVYVGGKTFDGAGRRVGLTISLAGMGLSLLVVSIAYFIMDKDVQEDLPSTKATIGVLVGICFYLSFFSIGMGPGTLNVTRLKWCKTCMVGTIQLIFHSFAQQGLGSFLPRFSPTCFEQKPCQYLPLGVVSMPPSWRVHFFPSPTPLGILASFYY